MKNIFLFFIFFVISCELLAFTPSEKKIAKLIHNNIVKVDEAYKRLEFNVGNSPLNGCECFGEYTVSYPDIIRPIETDAVFALSFVVVEESKYKSVIIVIYNEDTIKNAITYYKNNDFDVELGGAEHIIENAVIQKINSEITSTEVKLEEARQEQETLESKLKSLKQMLENLKKINTQPTF